MIYSNIEFIMLVAVATGMLRFGGTDARRVTLGFISLIFFIWSGWFNFGLIIAVVLLIWLAVRATYRWPALAPMFIWGGVGILAANLFIWKYWAWLSSELDIRSSSELGNFIIAHGLPIGISFYTLQGIAYLIDTRKGSAQPVGFFDLFLFKLFFGQLIAGPIVRYSELMPQVQAPPRATGEQIVLGIELFALGYFKKVVLADRAAVYADPIFLEMTQYSASAIILAVLLYTVQIWADFSGYTDMGRGAALMCGIQLPRNFVAPYLVRSPSEFWRNWHITLSTWIRDYIYIPLGGNRCGGLRNSYNLLITMFIGGLWHGANWTFALWGLFHGLLLALEHGLKRVTTYKLPGFLSIPMMFILIAFGWLLFRVQNLADAGYALGAIYRAGPAELLLGLAKYPQLAAATITFMIITFFIQVSTLHAARTIEIVKGTSHLMRGAAVGFLVLIAIAFRGTSAPFIYFQF